MDASIEEDASIHPAPVKDRGFLGCGLSGAALLAILTISVAIFLFWGGPLWSTRPGATHTGRIVASYAAVIPLVAACFLMMRRWSWVQLASSVAVVWSGKLIVTSSLYAYFATGSVQIYSPAPVVAEPAPATPAHPLASTGEIGRSEIAGVVLDHGTPASGVVVVARTVARTALPARRIDLVISEARYDHPIYLASVRDTVIVRNTDRGLHNVRARSEHRTVWNVPVPAGGEAKSLPLSVGVVELACDEHPSEHATLVVIDREPAAITDADGRFALRELSGEACDLDIFRNSSRPRRVHVVLVPDARADVSLDLAKLDQR